MNVASPHYLLFPTWRTRPAGRWRFVLRVDGSFRLDAEDVERGGRWGALELLAVVRGLEALDQPSRVTLITTSKYVREGIRHGVMESHETTGDGNDLGRWFGSKSGSMAAQVGPRNAVSQDRLPVF